MRRVELLLTALEYIEGHLRDDIRTEDVAAVCFCSKSTLEKTFRCVNRISVHDYVIRRRMMQAARLLAGSPDRTILDIALEYGYSTHESFARAFRQVWNCRPSEFRKMKYELYPRLRIPAENGGQCMMSNRHVDISELYDLFQERKDCFFICCDVKEMMRINEISHRAGDLAIIEAMERMSAAAGEGDLVFRIGGDEFCILTDSREESYAEAIAEGIRARNGESFSGEGREVPLYLHTTAVRLERTHVRYDELYTGLHEAIYEAIRTGRD